MSTDIYIYASRAARHKKGIVISIV